MAWCRQPINHYLDRCWRSTMAQYGLTRQLWNTSVSEPEDASVAANLRTVSWIKRMHEHLCRSSLFLELSPCHRNALELKSQTPQFHSVSTIDLAAPNWRLSYALVVACVSRINATAPKGHTNIGVCFHLYNPCEMEYIIILLPYSGSNSIVPADCQLFTLSGRKRESHWFYITDVFWFCWKNRRYNM